MNKSKLVNCKYEKYDIYIGRPSKYGNPWTHLNGTTANFKVSSRNKAIECYKNWLLKKDEFINTLPDQREWILKNIETLRGKILGCHCSPKKCHGEILIDFLYKKSEEINDKNIDEYFS